MKPKLRVGFMLDSILLPAWAFAGIQRFISSSYAELALIVMKKSPVKPVPARTVFWQRCNHWLYKFFNTVDEKLFLRRANASACVNISKIIADIPVLQMQPVGENDNEYLTTSDVEQIKSYQLDILVKLGFGTLHGDVLTAAKYGLWSYRWGDHRKIDDGLTGFWEVVDQWPETGAALQQLGTEAKSNRILYESWFFTYPFSAARNRNSILWSASLFLPRQVEKLYRLGEKKYFTDVKLVLAKDTPILRTNTIPSNLMVLWIMMKLTFRNLLEVYRRLFFREQWGLLSSSGSDLEKNIYTYKKISAPRGCFWADPHIIYRNPIYYIFVEEYFYRVKRGHISVIEIDSNGDYKAAVPVLSTAWHLSFPHVFEWQGRYYMIPESSEHRTIDLFECVRFPDRWQHKITLMKDVCAVDTIVFYTKRNWWLFTAIAEQEAASPQVELFLFYSSELFTDQWLAHPENPIVSDIKRARNAGSLFLQDGKIFRPSQDCSKTYGYGFDLNEITALSRTEYCERRVTSFRPDPRKKIIATHTYANQGDLTVIDALVRRPRWAKPA
jgi:hypothetical protein